MILAAPVFAVFEGWAFVLLAAGDFKLRAFSVAFKPQNLDLYSSRAHASNTTKRGAAEVGWATRLST